MAFTFYTSVSKWLKLKVRRTWGLIPTFVEVKGEKLEFKLELSQIVSHPDNIKQIDKHIAWQKKTIL